MLGAKRQEWFGAQGLQAEYRHCKSVRELRGPGFTLAVIKFGFMTDHYVTVLELSLLPASARQHTETKSFRACKVPFVEDDEVGGGAGESTTVASQSEVMMVAVGFIPRIRRPPARVAERRLTMPRVRQFKRRSATPAFANTGSVA